MQMRRILVLWELTARWGFLFLPTYSLSGCGSHFPAGFLLPRTVSKFLFLLSLTDKAALSSSAL